MEGIGKQYVRGASPELHRMAREKRENPTPAEAALWAALSGRKTGHLKFRFQHPVGQFILDFYCAAHKLALEVDGGGHEARAEEDTARTAYLEAYGYRVLRFRNEEVLTSLDVVLTRIVEALGEETPRSRNPPAPNSGGVGGERSPLAPNTVHSWGGTR